MLQVIAGVIIDTGLQAVGWAVLKGISFGRYRGFRAEDIVLEGTIGFAILAAVVYGSYRVLF